MKHKNKLKIARRMNGGLKKNAFITPQWDSRKKELRIRLKRMRLTQKRLQG